MKIQIIKVPGISLGGDLSMRDVGNIIIRESGIGGKADIEEIHVNNDDLEEQEKLILENSKEAFEKNEKTIFLGGDEVIVQAIIEAAIEVGGADVRIQEKIGKINVYELKKDSQKMGIIIYGIRLDEKEKISLASQMLREETK
jgi:hypothetical protein